MAAVTSLLILLVITYVSPQPPDFGREVARIDLTSPRDEARPVEVADECQDRFIDHSDGAISNDPGRLELRVVKTSGNAFVAGDTIQAELRLINTGKGPAPVPLSTVEIGRQRDAARSHREEGWFSVQWYGKSGYQGHLMLATSGGTAELFGSERESGSLITLLPGEWVTVKLPLKLELQPATEGLNTRPVKPGKGALHFAWHQGQYDWTGQGRQVSTAYQARYHSEAPPVPVEILTR